MLLDGAESVVIELDTGGIDRQVVFHLIAKRLAEVLVFHPGQFHLTDHDAVVDDGEDDLPTGESARFPQFL